MQLIRSTSAAALFLIAGAIIPLPAQERKEGQDRPPERQQSKEPPRSQPAQQRQAEPQPQPVQQRQAEP